MLRMINLIFLFVLCISGCSGTSNTGTVESKYPRKPADTSSRKAGPAMYLYEQAEEDLDVNNSVIVTPPTEKKKVKN